MPAVFVGLLLVSDLEHSFSQSKKPWLALHDGNQLLIILSIGHGMSFSAMQYVQ